MIPFNKPFIVGKELFNIARAVIEFGGLAGDGVFTQKCHDWLQTHLVCDKALLTHSCTGALEMAAILCGIEPGDEVIMPSFTFVSTANSVVLRGGVPVFVDIRPDTLNIDEDKIEQAITANTKAIIPVHYAGVPCAMDEICEIASGHNLFVIEDAAQSLLSKYKGRNLGTIGNFGALSFHETKNIISGEGGALLINDGEFIERAEIIWEKGTDRKKFFRGHVDKYTWVDIGSSYLPSEMTAAFLYAQFEHANHIIANRNASFELYSILLKPLAEKEVVLIPSISIGDDSNGHIFYIITKSFEERFKLIQFLKEKGISSVFHYVPLHSSPAGRQYCKTSGPLFHTDSLSERILRLPIFYGLKKSQIEFIVDTIYQFYKDQ